MHNVIYTIINTGGVLKSLASVTHEQFERFFDEKVRKRSIVELTVQND